MGKDLQGIQMYILVVYTQIYNVKMEHVCLSCQSLDRRLDISFSWSIGRFGSIWLWWLKCSMKLKVLNKQGGNQGNSTKRQDEKEHPSQSNTVGILDLRLQRLRQILDKFETMFSNLDREGKGKFSQLSGQGVVEDSAKDGDTETSTNSSEKVTQEVMTAIL